MVSRDEDHTLKQTNGGGSHPKRGVPPPERDYLTTHRDQNSHVSEIHVRTNLCSCRTETTLTLRLSPFK